MIALQARDLRSSQGGGPEHRSDRFRRNWTFKCFLQNDLHWSAPASSWSRVLSPQKAPFRARGRDGETGLTFTLAAALPNARVWDFAGIPGPASKERLSVWQRIFRKAASNGGKREGWACSGLAASGWVTCKANNDDHFKGVASSPAC